MHSKDPPKLYLDLNEENIFLDRKYNAYIL